MTTFTTTPTPRSESRSHSAFFSSWVVWAFSGSPDAYSGNACTVAQTLQPHQDRTASRKGNRNNVLASFALPEPRILVRRPHLVLVHSGVFYFMRDRVDADLVLWRGEVSAEVITGKGGGGYRSLRRDRLRERENEKNVEDGERVEMHCEVCMNIRSKSWTTGGGAWTYTRFPLFRGSAVMQLCGTNRFIQPHLVLEIRRCRY